MKTTVGVVEINGNPLTLMGEMVKTGDMAQDFTVMNNELKPVKFSEYAGKKIILSVMPSIDTPVCAAQTRRFNGTLRTRRHGDSHAVEALGNAYKRRRQVAHS